MGYKIFVDANVYLDFFQQRGNDWKEAEAIFQLAEKNNIEVITSSSIVLNLMYVLKRYDTPQSEIIKKLFELIKMFTHYHNHSNVDITFYSFCCSFIIHNQSSKIH